MSFDLQLLDNAGLFSEELDTELHLRAIKFIASDKSALVASPALLDQNCLPTNVLVTPFASEHAPASLDVLCCQSFFFSLLLSFTIH